jgi:hypothetical protein
MESFKIYQTSNIFFPVINVITSFITPEDNTRLRMELFIITENREKTKLHIKGFNYTKDLIDLFCHPCKNIELTFFEESMENSKQIIDNEIIYPSFKENKDFIIYLQNNMVFTEKDKNILIKYLFVEDGYNVILKIKELTKNKELSIFLQKILNISTRRICMPNEIFFSPF